MNSNPIILGYLSVMLLLILIILVIFLIIKLLSASKSGELNRIEERLSIYQNTINEIKERIQSLSLEFENRVVKNVSSDLSNTKETITNSLTKLKEEILNTKAALELTSKDSLSETRKKLDELEKSVSFTIANVNKSLTNTTTQLMKDITGTMEEINKTFSTQSGSLSQKIGEMTNKLENLEKISKEIKELQDILKPPKQRGIFGEILLENLLRDMLPSKRFSIQYSIGKNKVDAAIFLENKVLPVDAKFPLSNYQDYLQGKVRGFEGQVKKMIDDISEKYIKVKTSEGNTTNFAFMYIPSESVWYSLFIENTTLYSYAVKKRVFPVSPNTLFSYLHVISEGLNAFEIEENVEEILKQINSLKNDIENSVEHFEILKKHLLNAANKTESTIGFLKKISNTIDDFKRK